MTIKDLQEILKGVEKASDYLSHATEPKSYFEQEAFKQAQLAIWGAKFKLEPLIQIEAGKQQNIITTVTTLITANPKKVDQHIFEALMKKDSHITDLAAFATANIVIQLGVENFLDSELLPKTQEAYNQLNGGMQVETLQSGV